MEQLLRDAFNLGYEFSKPRNKAPDFDKWYKSDEVQQQLKILNIPGVTKAKGVSLPSDNESYEIAKKIYSYCYVGINDELYIGAKAIPKVIQLWHNMQKKRQ